MLKKSIILSFLFFSCMLLYGQDSNVKITIGQPYRVIDAPSKLYFYDNNEVMTVKLVKDLVIIQKFSSDLKFIQQREFKDMPDDAFIERINKHGDQYYLFYSLWDKRNKKEQLFYRKINFAKGILEKESVLLLSVDDKIISTGFFGGIMDFSIYATNKFNFQYSKDKSKLLIKYRVKPEKRDDSKSFDVIGMYVFDQSLNKLWNKEITMPYTEKKMNNLDYSIDSEGNSYILAGVYEDNTTDEKKSKHGGPNYHIELLRIKSNSSEIERTIVKLKDKFINKIALFETSEDYMICAGFYNSGTGSSTNGIFTFKIKKEGIAYDMITHEIPLEIINQYADKKTKKKNSKDDDAEYEDLSFDFMSLTADGGIVLGGEEYFVKSHTRTSNGRSRTYYTYHFNNILVTKLDNQGNLGWIKKIPKRQVGSSGLGSLSYNFFKSKDSYYFTFLDNEKNENLTTDQVPAVIGSTGTGQLTTYKVTDDTGDIERIKLFDTRDVKGMEVFQLTPTRMVMAEDNKIIVEVYKKKKEDVLIKVEF